MPSPRPQPATRVSGGNARMLELMNDEELEGVIAHELSHVRNYRHPDELGRRDDCGSHHVSRVHGPLAMLFAVSEETATMTARARVPALLMIFLAPFAPCCCNFSFAHAEYSADQTGARMVGSLTADQALQSWELTTSAFLRPRSPRRLQRCDRKAVLWQRHLVVAVQHTSPPREAYPSSTGDDGNPQR